MEATTFVSDIVSLPPEAQKQVSDFSRLSEDTRYPVTKSGRKAKRTKLTNKPWSSGCGAMRGRAGQQRLIGASAKANGRATS